MNYILVKLRQLFLKVRYLINTDLGQYILIWDNIKYRCFIEYSLIFILLVKPQKYLYENFIIHLKFLSQMKKLQ